ncbi:MAG: hypothetical protein KME03_07520 [Aphanocapsa lilacina HA4352-LM1]|jgi:hypothetical protein|nr:hypothetical protein [Aphanocapsa lilacina HA4352-LM1]
MLTPFSDGVYQGTTVQTPEHPACELFPASRTTGQLFGLGVVLGIASLFLDGFGAGPWSWPLMVMAGLVLLFAGSRVARS